MQLTFQKISTGNGLQTTNYLPNGKFGSWFDTLGGTVSVWQFGGSVCLTFVTISFGHDSAIALFELWKKDFRTKTVFQNFYRKATTSPSDS